MLRGGIAPADVSPALVQQTLDDVEAFVASLPATARGVARFGLRIPEWAATRSPALRRLAALPRDLVAMAYFEQSAVRDALGYRPEVWVAAVRERRATEFGAAIRAHADLLAAPSPLRDGIAARRGGAIRSGRELPTDLEVDVVIVGSGAGGAVVAAELAEAGLSVAVLEEGGHHPTSSFTTQTLDMLRTLYRDSGATSTLGRAPIQFSEGRCVGGSTVVNGGMAFRAPERVLRRWTVDAGVADLDAEYARVERFLNVAPPDPASIGRDQALMKLGADRLGWRTVESLRAHVHCGGCNVCVWGCPTGAKQSTLVSYLPRAVAFGAEVWAGCRVDRVLMRGKRAVGVVARVNGQPVTVRAHRVVLAAGAVQTPALLQRSRISAPGRMIGHNLTLHPGAAVVARFDEVVDGWTGAHQSYQVREFEDDGIILAAVNLPPALVSRMLRVDRAETGAAMADYPRMVTAGVLVEDTGRGRVRAVGRDAVVTYPVTTQDAARVMTATTRLCEALFAAGAREIHLPVTGAPVARTLDDVRRVEAGAPSPDRLDLSTVHLMGTARIGRDPLTSVCDAGGRVRDTDRLFVADASLFPGPVGVNPQLTVMALATRVAGSIIDEC